jgi:hypothetical protein
MSLTRSLNGIVDTTGVATMADCLTVALLRERLATLPDDLPVIAWARGDRSVGIDDAHYEVGNGFATYQDYDDDGNPDLPVFLLELIY